MTARVNLIRSSIVLACTLLAATASLAQTIPNQDPPGQRVFALVVGIAKYPKVPGGFQLQFADRDAIQFAEALKKAGVSSDSVRLLVGQDATATAIKGALGNWLARAAETDTVYFFFSGHGIVESAFKESYLLAFDSDPKDPYATALSVAEIGRAFSTRVRARRVLVLGDAIRRDFFDPDTDGPATSTAFADSFGQLVASRPGLSVVLANAPNEFSREGQRWGGSGVFAKYLVDALAGAGDQDGDGSISSDEFFEFVHARVSEDTANKQHPWRASSTLADLTLPRVTAKSAGTVARAPANTGSTPVRVPDARGNPTPAGPPQPKVEAIEPIASTKTPETAATSTTIARKSEGTPPPAAERTPEVNPPTTSATSPANSSVTAPATSPSSERARPDNKVAVDSSKETTPSASTSRTVPPTSSVARPGTTTASVPAPPRTPRVNSSRAPASGETSSTGLEPESIPPPPKPLVTLPSGVTVTGQPVPGGAENVKASVPVASAGAVPSPLVLQVEAAMSEGNLIEPKDSSAWDYYQKLAQDPASSTEAARLKPALGAALLQSGSALLTGDIRADNVSDKVDQFRRAGQMLARARTLAADPSQTAALEKLSAAQALVALQFYDEAEKALVQLQSSKLAPVENALGLAYLGGLNEWQAERAFKRAIDLDQKWAAPHYNLGLLYRGQKKDALEQFEQAAALDLNNPAFLVALADEHFSREKWADAVSIYRRAIAAKPNDDVLHTKLGHALYSQGLRDEANKEYQKARELRGNK